MNYPILGYSKSLGGREGRRERGGGRERERGRECVCLHACLFVHVCTLYVCVWKGIRGVIAS